MPVVQKPCPASGARLRQESNKLLLLLLSSSSFSVQERVVLFFLIELPPPECQCKREGRDFHFGEAIDSASVDLEIESIPVT